MRTMRMKKETTAWFGVLLAAAFADCAISRGVKYDYAPQPVVGYPAGLVPNCPGVMKNVTIHPRNMQNLQLIIHRVERNGQIHRDSVPIMSAAKTVAKEKSIDLKNKKTIVYAVGFWDSSLFPHSQAMGTEFVRLGYNVFIAETFAFLTQIYPKSVRISRAIGLKIGEFLVKLHGQGLRAENLELVGLSLGAHIVSYAAKHFYLVTGEKPSRLTGLDPAGPCYRNLPPIYKFDKSDAVKVDVLHTNIDGFGTAEPLGHVDFYANGGEYQPSDVPYIPCLVICSHIRSVIYYWQSLQHAKGFIGVKCDSVQDARFANCYNGTVTNYLGPNTNFNKPGIYYLPTLNVFPYYRGKEGLKAENEIYTSISTSINAEDDLVV